MQCGVEERVVRSVRKVGVKCFKCGEERHKCRECLLWIKRRNEEKAVHVAKPRKVQQEERPACPVKGKAQEGERRLRRAEEEAAHPTEGKAQQKEWRRSLWKALRKRAEWYCGPTVP